MSPLQDVFCKLGICFYNEAGQIKSAYEAINDLSKIWNTLTEDQKELFTDIFKENGNEK